MSKPVIDMEKKALCLHPIPSSPIASSRSWPKPAGVRPAELASRAGVSLEVVEACLREELPAAMVLYRVGRALYVTMERILGKGRFLDDQI